MQHEIEHDFDPHTDVCRACHLPRDCFAEIPQIVCSGGSSQGHEQGKRMTDIPRVDRSQQELTDGSPVPEDRSHTRHKPNGQQQGWHVERDAKVKRERDP